MDFYKTKWTFIKGNGFYKRKWIFIKGNGFL